jgi:hypothetical protein
METEPKESPAKLPSCSQGADPQFDPIVRSVNQILLGAEIPLGRLHGGMSQEKLNLFQFAARGPAQFGACAAVMPHAA